MIDDYEAQIVRLTMYLATSMPDFFICKDGSTVDVAIAALATLAAEVERLRFQLDHANNLINVMCDPAFDEELGHAGL